MVEAGRFGSTEAEGGCSDKELRVSKHGWAKLHRAEEGGAMGSEQMQEEMLRGGSRSRTPECVLGRWSTSHIQQLPASFPAVTLWETQGALVPSLSHQVLTVSAWVPL